MAHVNKVVYNPHQQTEDQLISQFIVHKEVFNRVWKDIKVSTMVYPEQHYIIEGQRGMGKTTMLLKIAYEIERDPELSPWLVPVVLEEESYFGITKLYKLWEEIARVLESDQQFTGLYEQMAQSYDQSKDYEAHCFNLLVERLGTRRLLLLIDNVNEIFRNFKEIETYRLREILLTRPEIRLIGAASISLEAFSNYKDAFYSFFKRISLHGLSYDETRLLLLDLGKLFKREEKIITILEQQPERVESLRIMSGGVIRTIVILFDIFSNDSTTDALEDLEVVLEQVTSLYKHRMDDLEPAAREIVQVLCLNWDAMRPYEIAKEVRSDESEVRRILEQLEKVYFVQWHIVDESKDFYQIYERFFNIWFLMRKAPKDYKKKIIWLVRFFTSWYSRDEIRFWVKKHLESMKNQSSHPILTSMLANALVLTGKLDLRTEHILIQQTRHFLSQENRSVSELLPSEEEILEHVMQLYTSGHREKALELINAEDYRSHCLLGNFYMEMKDYQKARDCFEAALEDDQENINAYNGLGRAHYYLDEKEKARSCMEKALAIDGQFARARSNLGLMYSELNDYDNAIKHYQLAAASDPNDIDSWWGLGYAYAEKKDYVNAETSYLSALQVDDQHQSIWTNLGYIYQQTEQYEKADQAFLKVTEINPEDIEAWANLAKYYSHSGRYRLGIEYFGKVVRMKRGNVSVDVIDSLEWLAMAEVLQEQDDPEQAIAALEKAYELDQDFKYWIKQRIFSTFFSQGGTSGSVEKLMKLLAKFSTALTIRTEDTWAQPLSVVYPALPWLTDIAKVYKLPFFREFHLLTISRDDKKEGVYAFLTNGTEFWPMDTVNTMVYSICERDLALTRQNVVSYCLFFFDVVMGRHGKFHLLRDTDDMPWWPKLIPTDALLEKVNAIVKAPAYLGDSDGAHHLEWYMVFKDAIFKSAVRVDPGNGWISMADEKLLCDNLPIREVDKEEGFNKLFLLQQKVKENPGSGSARLEIGKLLHDVVMDFEQAALHLSKAIELSPELKDAWVRLGSVYQQLGRDEEAFETYVKVVEAGYVQLAKPLSELCLRMRKDKDAALKYALMADQSARDFETRYTLATVYLWHHQAQQSIDTAHFFLYEPSLVKEHERKVIQYLLHLCAEHQEAFVKDYVDGQAPNFGDFFKPVYYLVLRRLGDVDYKRMPIDFTKTIDDLESEIVSLNEAYR